MRASELPKLKWTFRSHSVNYHPRWAWSSINAEGVVCQSADSFPSLSLALADANKHGFSAAYDQYAIV